MDREEKNYICTFERKFSPLIKKTSLAFLKHITKFLGGVKHFFKLIKQTTI
jgi:hypothetical protein